MSIDPLLRHKLKKLIKELAGYRGRHTELVTVYVPAGYDLNAIINHLYQEAGTASNIKSTSTRKNVEDALEKMIQHLRIVGRTPKNGLMAFSGNVSEKEGQSDVRVWSIEPPVPLNQRLYRCDKVFVLEALEDIVAAKEIYGLVVMDRREATIALLRGKSIDVVAKSQSAVPGKTRAGGQSAHRFEQLRENAAHEFFTRIGEHIKDCFFPIRDSIRGILLGGPGPTKYEFHDGNFITTELKNKIIAIKDITYTDEFGLQELLERSEENLANEEVMKEKKVVTNFFQMLVKAPGKTAYGKKDVMEKLQMGGVDLLILSEGIDEKIVEEFEQEAEKMGTNVTIVSTETREGAQLKEIGGVAALLRYDMSHHQ